MPHPIFTHTAFTDRSHFYVAQWRVEPGANTILGPGGVQRVEPKVMQVLVCLAAHAGEAVTREHLLDTVWPDTIVEENALSRTVSQLRKAFRDDPRTPTVIQTIPKTGYRLIAPLILDPQGDAAPDLAGDPQGTLALPPVLSVPPVPLPPARVALWKKGVAFGLLLAVLGFVAWQWRYPFSPIHAQNLLPLTAFPGAEAGPAVSPDGSQVAFTWSTPERPGSDLYVQLIGSDTPLQLTDGPATSDLGPAWSPDGRTLAFVRREGSSCSLYTVPTLGGLPRKITDCAADIRMGIAWSPDGNTLAFSERATLGEPYRLTLLNLETLSRQPLTTPPPATEGDVAPTFSPDGTMLAFSRNASTTRNDLYRIPVAGGEPVPLTTDQRYLAGHDWTPDGQSLVFSSNRTGTFKLWQLDLRTGNLEWLAGIGAYDPGGPTLARTAQRLAFVEWYFDFNLWRHPLHTLDQPNTGAVWANSTRWELMPSYSPDGKKVAFTSDRSGSNEIWVAAADGTAPMRLTDFGTGYTSTPRWSPDGTQLVFSAYTEHGAALYVIDAAGGSPQQRTHHPGEAVAPSWSPDGQTLFFGSNRTGSWQIWQVASDGSTPATQVTKDGGYAAKAAADGEWLYFSKRTEAGLWRMPIQGGAPTRLFTSLSPDSWGEWVLRDDSIYFVERPGPNTAFLAKYDLATSESVRLAPFPTNALDQPTFTLSPDGQWLLYTRLDQLESDIMLVDWDQ